MQKKKKKKKNVIRQRRTGGEVSGSTKPRDIERPRTAMPRAEGGEREPREGGRERGILYLPARKCDEPDGQHSRSLLSWRLFSPFI